MESFFIACAVLGGALFLVRLAAQFIGGPHDADFAPVETHDTDLGFKILSLQGITAFFMMFGLVGWALLKQKGIGETWAICGAVAAGIGSVWLISQIIRSMKRLESSGTMDPTKAVGQVGTVYLTIPAGGTGKAQVAIQGQSRILDAVARNKEEIKTEERIRVAEVVNGSLLVVERI